ncbi:MAG TPA: hypothetical protein VF230_02255 [Acidimicrobiales bacterium]
MRALLRRGHSDVNRRAAIGLAATLAVFAVPLRGAFGDIGGAMEEGFMLVFPERVLAGDVPNRDFLHLYGPASLWTLALAFSVFGARIAVERTVGAAQLLGVVLAVRSWTRPWGEATAAGCGAIAAVFALTPIGLVALPWMGAMALLLWGTLLVTRSAEGDASSPARLAGGGGCLVGLALCYRPDLALAVGLVAAVTWRAVAPRRRAVATGLLAGVVPILVHVAIAGPRPSIDGMFVDPVFRLRAGRHLPVPPSSDVLDGYLQRIAELDVLDWPAPLTVPVQIRVWFFAVVVATFLAIAAAVLAARRADRSPLGRVRAQRLAVLAALSAGVLPQAVQRPDSTHLAWVSALTIAMAPVAIAELLQSTRARDTRVSLPAGFAVVALAAVLAFPAFTLRPYAELARQTLGRGRTAIAVEHSGRTFYVGRADVAVAVEALAPLVERQTESGDRLFVGPADLTRTAYVDSWLYHLFPDLDPATRYIEMDPGIADREGSGLDGDLASADVALLTATWDDWVEPNASVERGDDAAARVLAERFCLVAEQSGVALYRKCA